MADKEIPRSRSRYSDETPPLEFVRESMRRIARYQRWVILAVGAKVSLRAMSLFGVLGDGAFVGVVGIAALLFSLLSVFLLSRELYSFPVALLLTLAVIVPLAGLIVLLVLVRKSTGLLRENGAPVGLFGASTKHFD